MKPSVWAAVFFLMGLFLLVATGNAEVSLQQPSSIHQTSVLKVQQDQATGKVTIDAHQVSLGEVLDHLSQVTGLQVRTMNEDIRQDAVDVQLEKVSLKESVDQLLAGMNAIFFFKTPYGSEDQSLEPRLSKVMVLSRKDSPSVEPRVVRNPDIPVPGTQKRAVSRRPVNDKDIIQAIRSGHPNRTRRVLQNLVETGTPREKEETVANLGDMVMTPSEYNTPENGHVFYETLNALKELDPQSGETFLGSLLESSDEPWVQSLAVENLGEWGATNSTDSLLHAFRSPSPLVRQAATSSLAKVGNEQGITQLIEAAQYAEPQFQQMIATAIVSSGNENSMAALNQAIDNKLIPEEAIYDPSVVADPDSVQVAAQESMQE